MLQLPELLNWSNKMQTCIERFRLQCQKWIICNNIPDATVLFHRITESSDEDIDQLVIDQCNEKLNLSITRDMLERTHQLGPKRDQGGKPPCYNCKICSYRNRCLVFINKIRLKGTGVTLTESLMELVKEVHKIVGDGNTWTSNRNVFAKKGQCIFKLTIKEDITQLTA